MFKYHDLMVFNKKLILVSKTKILVKKLDFTLCILQKRHHVPDESEKYVNTG